MYFGIDFVSFYNFYMDKMSVNEAFREQQIYLKKNEHLIKPHTFLKFEVEMPFSMRVIPISK